MIIATPVFLHAEHFEAAVKAGKHIYIEKPASADVEGCKRIMRAADCGRPQAQYHLRISAPLRPGVSEGEATGGLRRDRAHPDGVRAHFIKSEGGVERNRKSFPRQRRSRRRSLAWHGWKDLSGDLIVENNVHSIDVLNWFLGGRPEARSARAGRHRPKHGDMRDHNFVAFEYATACRASFRDRRSRPHGYRDVVEQFFGEKGMIETSENHWRHYRGPDRTTTEKSPRNITIDSVAEFVQRIAEGKPENTGVRGAESTLTAILGRMAMDQRREVTWDEMMKG